MYDRYLIGCGLGGGGGGGGGDRGKGSIFFIFCSFYRR